MKTVFSIAILFIGLNASANDGGMPYIEAQELTLSKADLGTKISFKGPEAISLFNVLPSMQVYGHTRGFMALGKQKALSIVCEDQTFDEKSGKYVLIKGGPSCEVKVVKAELSEGDNQKWINDRQPQSDKNAPKRK